MDIIYRTDIRLGSLSENLTSIFQNIETKTKNSFKSASDRHDKHNGHNMDNIGYLKI